MAWDTDTDEIAVSNIATFGVSVVVTHVTGGRTYNVAAGKTTSTVATATITAMRGEDYTVKFTTGGSDTIGRRYFFVFDPAATVLKGQTFNLDREDRLLDGVETWTVTATPITECNGHVLVVACVRVKTTGG